MRFKLIEEAVERNIVELFKIFYKNPAIFLCETDVESFMKCNALRLEEKPTYSPYRHI
jgi:hypothetical protein